MIVQKTRFLLPVLVSAAMIFFSGCGRAPAPTVMYVDILETLLDTEQIASLSQPGTRLFSSWDRTDGNDDYNNFLGDGPEGWKILCDIKGSGYISRSWFTGSKDGSKRIRFYIDGERNPRYEASLDEWCGTTTDFSKLPLRGYEPYCWFSWMPVSFSTRLVVMEEAPLPGEKIYYQINVNMLPEGEIAESWQPEMLRDTKVRDLKERINLKWEELRKTNTAAMEKTVKAENAMETDLWKVDGHGTVEEVRIAPNFPGEYSVADHERALRALVVRMYWDGLDLPSVEVPLGALCGSMWHEIQYGSVYFGMSSDVYRVSFPMPFRKGARISILNEDTVPLEIGVAVEVSGERPGDTMGYFHSGWRKSTPDQVGAPHLVLNTAGHGKYVGCILGVISLDSSWWALESDEHIYVDGEREASWRGTGLEDYFNAGWYYGNALASPFHGIPFKAPYRTVQYRVHPLDPVTFDSAVLMSFERGPNHVSRAEMESVSFYYLDEPAKADSVLSDLAARRPVDDPVRPYTLMTEVNNMERLGDVTGALRALRGFLERHPDVPFRDVLESRIVNYTDPPVIPEGHAVLGAYANTQIRVFLDGKLLFGVNDTKGERVHFREIPMEKGEHVIVVQYTRRPYPDWVQITLEYPDGFLGTDNTWKYAFNPGGRWTSPDFDDSGWPLHNQLWAKGPPEAPYVWCEPHDRIFTQSRAWALRAPVDWPANGEFAVFRKSFIVP